MIFIGPTGSVTKGNVLDVDKKGIERALKAYDPQLYLRWNPHKIRGWGCWELRRHPAQKRAVDWAEFNGNTVVRYEYCEEPLVHHILDCAFLNYDMLNKLKSMDTWNKNHWWHDSEYTQQKIEEKNEAIAMEELKYNIRYNKKAMKEFMELVRSGMNPAQILTSIKWVYNQQ